MNETNDESLYLNQDLDVEERVDDLLSRLTLDEKISLLTKHTGFSFKPIDRLGIPEFKLIDGPHGVGGYSVLKKKNTYFPSLIGLSASWDPNLAYEYGEALAEETRAVGRHCILAPAINIHRTPLNGRNFEYFTEDPFLNSKMVVPLVKGIQSKRIAACVKHFICNNSEKRRRFSDSIVDERTLEEIYYPGFKAAVSEGETWVIMGAYNKVNGHYVYEDKHLLTEKLRDEWGFKGFVVSDWFATHSLKSPSACINAGFTSEMPAEFIYGAEMVKKSYEKGEFSIETLNENIRRLIRVMFYVGLFDSEDKIPEGSRNSKEHLEIARRIVEEGAVLLKNENKILPIDLEKHKKICITGPMADYKPLFKFFGGSSSVHPPVFITPLKALQKELKGKVKIVKKPENADIVILITGITQWYYGDCEGMDKEDIELSKKKINQIKKIASKNSNTIVILYNGGPLAMSKWIDDVPAILEVWQPHQEGGHAIVNLLLGYSSPSGKLPTTFPIKYKDSSAHESDRTYPEFKSSYLDMFFHEVFYVNPKRAHKAKPIEFHYDEGVFVGYRYFDKNNIKPLFPFGFGLSYTKFEYSNLTLDKNEVSRGDKLQILVDVKNIGRREGSEIVQVYASDIECSVDRPPKELVGFSKARLKPGEKKSVQIDINVDDLAFYDVKLHDWNLEAGDFNLLVGSSSRNIKVETLFKIT